VKAPNIGARARVRLLRLAKERGDDFQLVLLRFVHERLLYRLASSSHAGSFVLKGATLFTVWTGQPHRATRDLDLLGFGDATEEHLRTVFAEIATTKTSDDGVAFDPATIQTEPIRAEEEYGGVRVYVEARVATAAQRPKDGAPSCRVPHHRCAQGARGHPPRAARHEGAWRPQARAPRQLPLRPSRPPRPELGRTRSLKLIVHLTKRDSGGSWGGSRARFFFSTRPAAPRRGEWAGG
jgi:hypothetical protein